MIKIELNEGHIQKLTEITEYYFKNEYTSFKISENCLFCRTPVDYFFIHWFEYLNFNLIRKFKCINETTLNNLITNHILNNSMHPIDYLHNTFIIEKN